jgi:copper homeostasis protein
MKQKIEVCCFSVVSAIIAEKTGADRIELCDNYYEGGTTPSYASIKLAIKELNIPVNIIVRPRGGDFLYSDIEYELIKEDVLIAKKLNANGIVIGFLNTDGSIDIERTKEIIEIAKPMEVTFHRAFDRCKNPLDALEQLIELGVDRILTSGQKKTAIEGIDLLSELVKKANNRIIIMPGSGINDKNISKLITKTKAIEYHSSAKMFKLSKMDYINSSFYNDSEIKYANKTIFVDEDKLKKMINQLTVL